MDLVLYIREEGNQKAYKGITYMQQRKWKAEEYTQQIPQMKTEISESEHIMCTFLI